MLLKGKKDVIATPCVSGYKSEHLKRKKQLHFLYKKKMQLFCLREKENSL